MVDLKQKRLKKIGSHPFEVTITDLAANANKVYGFESDTDIQKFLPLNFCRIINKSGQDLKIYIGQKTDGEVILDDTIFNHYGDFFSFKLENLSATTTATGATTYTTVQRKIGG